MGIVERGGGKASGRRSRAAAGVAVPRRKRAAKKPETNEHGVNALHEILTTLGEDVDIVRETRAQATERVTCQIAAWLWHNRGCRAVVREAGITSAGTLATAWGGEWRVDVAGVASEFMAQHASIKTFVCEVKGTVQDLAREADDITAQGPARFKSKWHQKAWGEIHELWLVCGDKVTADYAVVDVPDHWGVMWFSQTSGRPIVARKPKPARYWPWNSPLAVSCWRACAEVASACAMPKFFNSRKRGDPWRTLLAVWFSGDAKDQQQVSDNKQSRLF